MKQELHLRKKSRDLSNEHNPGWRSDSSHVDDKTTIVHIHPIDDAVEHDLVDDCICGTDQELWTDEDFTKMCVIVSHNSLDGREAYEEKDIHE